MIGSIQAWRREWDRFELPEDAIPAHPELGLRYPWQELILRSMSALHRHKVKVAMARMREALSLRVDWRLSWSAGKDSTALAGIAAASGYPLRAIAEKDDLDYPGEEVYLQKLGAFFGHTVEVLRPSISLLAWLAEQKIDLSNDLHSQAASLSREHFYGVLAKHRKEHGYTGVILGLRATESKHRAKNRATHGWLYQKTDGLWVACPLADWEDMDVHAYLLAQNLPLLPMYFCIDPGMDPLKLRKSWWVAGGEAASRGHYLWLRRWFPGLWEQAAHVDPRIRLIS